MASLEKLGPNENKFQGADFGSVREIFLIIRVAKMECMSQVVINFPCLKYKHKPDAHL